MNYICPDLFVKSYSYQQLDFWSLPGDFGSRKNRRIHVLCVCRDRRRTNYVTTLINSLDWREPSKRRMYERRMNVPKLQVDDQHTNTLRHDGTVGVNKQPSLEVIFFSLSTNTFRIFNIYLGNNIQSSAMRLSLAAHPNGVLFIACLAFAFASLVQGNGDLFT